MQLKFDSEFIFIGRGDESFLENYSYELSSDPDGSGGKIYMSLEILNNQAEAEDIGEAIFANFKQKFYEEISADPQIRFEDALKVVNLTIETLKEEKVSRFIGNLNIAIGAIVQDALFIATTGDSEVYLIRKRFVSIVSEGLSDDDSKDIFVNIANGTLEPGDTVLFSSSRLLRYITKSEMGKILSEAGSRIGKSLADLQDFIMTEILGRAAVLGISVQAAPDTEDENMFDAAPRQYTEGVMGYVNKYVLEPGKWLAHKASRISWKMPSVSRMTERAKAYAEEKHVPKIHFRKQEYSREQVLIAAIVLLALLVGGVFWIRTRGSTRAAIAEQQSKLNQVRELMNDASTVGQFDKAKASELLVSSEKLTLEVLSSRYLRGEAVKTLDGIQKSRDSLDDVKRITEPTLLADFSQKRSTASMLGLLALKEKVFGFEYNALYELLLDKLQEPLTISDIETVILGADFPDQNSLLFLTRTGKLIEFKDNRFSYASTKDGLWKKGVDIKTYNDKLYILDSERNQIWRYIRRRDGFDIGEAYNQNAEIQKGVSLAIDSNVYVLNADGFITQLYQGQKQAYPLRKQPLVAITGATKIYTNPDLNYLFILEPGRNRVVLYRKDTKNGGAQYHTQYVFDKVGVLRDLIVTQNRLYVMDETKVYMLNLSGLE